jgi:FMN phosphatase YigB (HAD superfamily)
MEKQIILFDIDKTLFDVHTFFNTYVWPSVEKDLSISRVVIDDISATYQKTLTKKTEFHPEGWLQVAEEILGEKTEQVRPYFYNPDYFVGSLFTEVIPTLNSLREVAVLGIYSEGVLEWQTKKIELSGINNYFEQKYISISEDKVSDSVLEWIPNKSVIVDDREDFILELAKLEKVSAVWVNREDKETLPNTMVITNLTQLLPMLERIRREYLPQR